MRSNFSSPRRSFLAAAAMATVAIAAGGVAVSDLAAGQTAAKINTIGSDGVAIRGYDPVAYFRDGGPRQGKAAFSLTHAGATWHFASAENKALFAADPETYMPAYGGYCAYGVAKGGLFKTEPDAWAIRGGRLYLNFDRSVQATWAKGADRFIATADRNWPALAKK